MLIFHNTEDRAKAILKEIVDHFMRPEIKEIFPEFAVRDERHQPRLHEQKKTKVLLVQRASTYIRAYSRKSPQSLR